MNVDKVSKVESSYVNRNPSGRIQGSSTSSKACSPNNRLNEISDGNKTIKSHLSCKRVLCSSGAAKPSLSNKVEIKISSSNTTRTWNKACRRLLCSFGGSKPKPSNPPHVSFNKKNEIKSPVEGSSKNDLRSLVNKSLVPSPKHVIPCINNKEKESGQPDSSKASNSAYSRNIKPLPVTKKHIQKTAVPKDPPPNNLRNKAEKSEVSTTRKKDIQKPEEPTASTVPSVKREIPKSEVPKQSLIGTLKMETRRAEAQKTRVSKITAAPTKNIDTKKTSTTYYEEKDHPSLSHYQPYSDIPVYHIRWDGHDDEHNASGPKCTLCEKDLSCSPNGVDRGSHEDDEYKYQIHFRPQILPAVDILPCGHVFHTECSRLATPEEESTDPECVFCLSMV